MSTLPPLSPAMGFDEACAAVVAYLKETVPLGYWAVTRYDGERQLYLSVQDDAWGLQAGDSHLWEESLCQYAVRGEAPQVAPEVQAVPVYEAAPVARKLGIRAFAGIPVEGQDGRLFGTLCGLDPRPHPDLVKHEPLLRLLASLLSSVLQADELRTEQARRMEAVELRAETDQLTGLLNRRGWERWIELEEARYRRFGDPGAVVVLDLDRLKEVNDTLGHAAGDAHIRTAADALRSACRDEDVVARLGGDEFGVIAARTTPDEAQRLVERLRAALEAAGVAGSFGHAPYTVVTGFPGAWEEADRRMYEEKTRRRGTPHVRRLARALD